MGQCVFHGFPQCYKHNIILMSLELRLKSKENKYRRYQRMYREPFAWFNKRVRSSCCACLPPLYKIPPDPAIFVLDSSCPSASVIPELPTSQCRLLVLVNNLYCPSSVPPSTCQRSTKGESRLSCARSESHLRLCPR